MKKVVNINDYGNKAEELNKLDKIKLTREERIQARNDLICDDDIFIRQIILE